MMVPVTISTFNRKPNKGRPELIRALYKSDLEDDIAEQLETCGVPFTYEAQRIPYAVPAREAVYVTDFELPGGIIIEGKGRFGHRGNQKVSTAERQKFILLKKQRPELDIRFVFSNPKTPIYKGSKTTYAQWADTHGFPWAAKLIPTEWIDEAKANVEEI
jgi:hypothetical protein